jgi:hypothetical protein
MNLVVATMRTRKGVSGSRFMQSTKAHSKKVTYYRTTKWERFWTELKWESLSAAYANNSLQQEKNRLDIMHHLITIRLDNRLHLAPIGKNPHRILDLGTGTGIWAIEMGEFVFCVRAISILHIYFLGCIITDRCWLCPDRGCLSFRGSMNIPFCHFWFFFSWEIFDRGRANICFFLWILGNDLSPIQPRM